MSIFSKVAMPKPDNNKFDLSHDRKFSMKIGELTPILCQETIPGDKWDIESTNMMRFAPMLAPIMHKVSVYIHYFFVPNRIVWDNWETFISGGEDGLQNPPFPTFTPSGQPADIEVGSLGDYLGMPIGDYSGKSFNAIPFAAYNKIYNEYYRDQNLITKLDDTLNNGNNTFSNFNTIQKRAWQHDYFTSALPWTQKGPEATIPLGTQAPLVYGNFPQLPGLTDTTYMKDPASSGGAIVPGATLDLKTDQDGKLLDNLSLINPDVSATHVADLSTATASSINDLRRAFRLQEWLERNARGGSRYIEIILAHFGVNSSDSRLQRPEFLGGSATPVTISEVLQTSSVANEPTPQANMAGHGVAVGQSNKVSYFCEEHGFIIGIMSVMPKTAYQQGIPKVFNKFDKFDYFWPSFQSIGEQPIQNQEIYWNETGQNPTAEETFGYTPRYAEYKYIPSTVHGEFKTTLNFWHMGRIFNGLPALNQQFIECDNADVERVFAVQDVEQLYVYLHNDIQADRKMVYFGTPTI